MPLASVSFKRRYSIKATVVMGFILSACLFEQALAVFTFTNLVHSPRRLTLQVGSSQFGTVNSVTFNVTHDKLSPNNTPIEGSPSNTAGTAATTPANGVLVRVTSEIPIYLGNTWQAVKLTVDSPLGLNCVGGTGCGNTIIPFNTISWQAYNRDASGLDLADGVFDGGTTQTLVWLGTLHAGLKIENTLVFTYANSTLYPAGQYTGRVIYTASLP